MKGTLGQLLEKLSFKQRAYQATFGAPGTAAHDAFVDLARFSHAFHNEAIPGDSDMTMRMAGRREAFFHIWQFLHLDPKDLVEIYPKIVIGDER